MFERILLDDLLWFVIGGCVKKFVMKEKYIFEYLVVYFD